MHIILDRLRTLSDLSGSRKSKMADDKPEVVISQLVDLIATRFQRLPLHYWDPATQWYSYSNFKLTNFVQDELLDIIVECTNDKA